MHPIHFVVDRKGWLLLMVAAGTLLLGAIAVSPQAGIVAAQGPQPQSPQLLLGNGFTYQGQLLSSGSAVNVNCDFQFGLYDALSGGSQLGITQTVGNVGVSRGLFTALVNAGNEFGDTAFTGDARWLLIAARCPTGGGAYTALSPRQPLTALPFALPGLRTFPKANSSPNIVGGYSGNSITGGAVGSTIGGGAAAKQFVAFFGGGNANTVTNSYAFRFHWRGLVTAPSHRRRGDHAPSRDQPRRARREESSIKRMELTPRLAAGTAIKKKRNYATVGGGQYNHANGVAATVGGGSSNQANGNEATVGGGASDQANGDNATVGGGYSNQANQYAATVGGGHSNLVIGTFATVGGGQGNLAINASATVGGGYANTVSGNAATIPGGAFNLAQGNSSFAAGANAHAQFNGSFVWNDSDPIGTPFLDSQANEFNVRATGGVRFFTSNDYGAYCAIAAGDGMWSCSSDRNSKANFTDVNGRDMLARLSSLPIQTWNYKTQDALPPRRPDGAGLLRRIRGGRQRQADWYVGRGCRVALAAIQRLGTWSCRSETRRLRRSRNRLTRSPHGSLRSNKTRNNTARPRSPAH